jgi:hypothetical protein
MRTGVESLKLRTCVALRRTGVPYAPTYYILSHPRKECRPAFREALQFIVTTVAAVTLPISRGFLYYELLLKKEFPRGVCSDTSYPAQVRTGVFVTLFIRLRVKHGLLQNRDPLIEG